MSPWQVAFQDPGALAVSLEDFSVVFCDLTGSGLVEMALALQKAGKMMEKIAAPLCEGCIGFSTRQDLFYGYNDSWPCMCGACLKCLEEASDPLTDSEVSLKVLRFSVCLTYSSCIPHRLIPVAIRLR